MEHLRYLVILSVITLFVVIAINKGLKRLKRNRKQRINALRRVNPVITETPYEKPGKDFRETAQEGLNRRFTIFYRGVYIILFSSAALLAAYPYSEYLPPRIVSLLVTATAIIIGIAAKPLLEDFLAGVLISFSKKIRVGHTVLIENQYGTIEDITPSHTVVKLWDWRRFIIPNSQMLKREIINYSLMDSWHWAHVEFSVSPEADLRLVKEISIEVAQSNSYAAGFEEPSFWIIKAEKDAVLCWLATWVDSPARSWELRSEVLSEVVMKLSEAGIRTHVNHHDIRQNIP